MAIGRGEGLKYMDCQWETMKNSGSGPCTEAVLEYDLGQYPGPRTVRFTMRDENGFYDALLENRYPQGVAVQCSSNYYHRYNFPRRIKDKGKIQVDNPKTVIDEAIPSMEKLVATMMATFFEMRLGSIDAEDDHIVTSFSMPIFMLEDASASIKSIKEIAEEQKEMKARELVLGILSIVFAVIPFAGAAASALGGAARIASVALIIGEAGNAAVSIAEIVDNPMSAPFAILGMLIGATGLRVKGPRQAFKEGFDARRVISAKDLKLFSDEFRRKDALVQSIMRSCKR